MASGLALVVLALIFTYGRLFRTVEIAATAAGVVESDLTPR